MITPSAAAPLNASPFVILAAQEILVILPRNHCTVAFLLFFVFFRDQDNKDSCFSCNYRLTMQRYTLPAFLWMVLDRCFVSLHSTPPEQKEKNTYTGRNFPPAACTSGFPGTPASLHPRPRRQLDYSCTQGNRIRKL